jgi:hypothetical protein
MGQGYSFHRDAEMMESDGGSPSSRSCVSDENESDNGADQTESDAVTSGDDGGRARQRRGQRARWSSLEELRLEAYVKEKKSWPWIAGQLRRTKDAVTQHWRMMERDQLASKDELALPLSGGQPTSIDEEENLWLVEKLLAKDKRDGEVFYLVKWEGFPDDQNSWVKRDDISAELVDKFDDYAERMGVFEASRARNTG